MQTIAANDARNPSSYCIMAAFALSFAVAAAGFTGSTGIAAQLPSRARRPQAHSCAVGALSPLSFSTALRGRTPSLSTAAVHYTLTAQKTSRAAADSAARARWRHEILHKYPRLHKHEYKALRKIQHTPGHMVLVLPLALGVHYSLLVESACHT